jgi:hypothetical protein
LTSRLDNLDLEVKKFTASIQQMGEEIANQNRANAEKEDGYKVKKRTLDLLPDAENNIAKLQVCFLMFGSYLGKKMRIKEHHLGPKF